jgi:putative ABC transport system permease protein
MFKTILPLAIKSIWNRRYVAFLTIIAIALSAALLLGVERLRTESRNSFTNTIAGTDLIVGARTGATQLLLYSVFRMGDATNNISWQSYRAIADDPRVKWTIPMSLGDSHRGYKVLGTNQDYFQYYAYGNGRSLSLQQGSVFKGVFDAVIGAEVAEKLGYELGDNIVLAHGAGRISLVKHDDKPFSITGILNKTGTPIDRTIHVSLEGIEAIHKDWRNGMPLPGMGLSRIEVLEMELQPTTITAFLVGLNSKFDTFKLQRDINEYQDEALMAILPGVALQELWGIMGIAERTLMIISLFVVVVGLSGLVTAMLAGLNERRREMAILRSMGAGPRFIFLLITGETLLLTLLGLMLGLVLLYGLLFVSQAYIEQQYGLFIAIGWPSVYEWQLLALVVVLSVLISLVPAWRAYRYSLIDGMSVRV